MSEHEHNHEHHEEREHKHGHEDECNLGHSHEHNHEQHEEGEHKHGHEDECNLGHSHEHNHEHHEENEFHNHEHEHNHNGGCNCGHSHGHSHEHNHEHGEEERETPVWQIIVAAVLCGIGIILEHLNISFGDKILLGTDLKEIVLAVIFLCSFLLAGKNILLEAVENLFHGHVLDENFLMGVASVGAICLRQFPEACGIVILYQIGEHFEDFAVDKSRGTIEALTEMRPEHVLLKKGDDVVEVKPEEVQIGEIIEVRPGERIPLDGVVIKGDSFLDTSALTGESVPRKVNVGDEVMSGSINKQGVLEIRTTKMAGESTYTRILKLVEESTEKKTRQEQFVTRFAKIYTPIVCAAALLVAIVPSIITRDFATWVYRALMFLVVSCPCAIVISIPLSFCGGIAACGKKGLLVKGSTYIESLAKTKIAVFDKTGTLTKGTFKVTDIHAVNPKYSPDELLTIAAHAEKYSNHPISQSLKAAHNADCCNHIKIENASELTSRGIKVTIDGKQILAGNLKLMSEFNIAAENCPEHQNGTIIHVAVDGEYCGHIVINDELKEDSKEAIAALKKVGVEKTVMLTGDAKKAAEHIASEIGLDEVYSELLSGDKVSQVEKLFSTLAPRSDNKTKRSVGENAGGVENAPKIMYAAETQSAKSNATSGVENEATPNAMSTVENKSAPNTTFGVENESVLTATSREESKSAPNTIYAAETPSATSNTTSGVENKSAPDATSTGENKSVKRRGTLIFVGDGINDAPVLARADVGIGMGGVGSDAAVEAADIIIMDDKTTNIAEGIKISRKTVRIVYENLIGSLGIKAAILVLSAVGISNMWLAVFADVGVTILAILNAMRLL